MFDHNKTGFTTGQGGIVLKVKYMSDAGQYFFDEAVILGSGIAGLLNAQVCSNFFKKVTVIERDSEKAMGSFRSGTPQARHLHTITVRGFQYLNQLFPGFYENSVRAGAIPLNLRDNLEYLSPHSSVNQNHPILADLKILGASRPFLENLIRNEVSKLPNVNFLYDTKVQGIKISDGKVSSLSVVEGETAKQIGAKLVIDCTGRNSRLAEWLKAEGWPTPHQTIVNGNWIYLSEFFSLDKIKIASGNKKFHYYDITEKNYLGGALMPIENHQYVATIAYVEGQSIPESKSVLDCAKILRKNGIFDTLVMAESISSVYTYKKMENIRNSFKKVGLPQGLLVTGDSLCALNPKYGQGITVVAKNAIILQENLSDLSKNKLQFNVSFQKKLQDALENATEDAWSVAASTDLQLKNTKHFNTEVSLRALSSLSKGYLRTLYQLAETDAEVTLNLLKVINLLITPTELFSLPFLTKIAINKFLDLTTK